ncbi:MAG TPA: alpha/beta fold hydrolase [Solirubrobacterales bacterium]|nr:alpha/beta fold hydrolase [Solirubrobacterales bacterium]
MRRGWKIAIGVVAALVVLLLLNALIVGQETKPAGVTEPGGKLVGVSGGELEVVESGPRNGSPIVLIHCFTCAINYWNGMIPRLARDHRVVAVDLLGHGGSEKPGSGYSVSNQADVIAEVLSKLGVSDAEVVGHSLGGGIAVALAQQSPDLVNRVVIVDTPPTHEDSSLGLIAKLGFAPVVGEAFWRIKPDFAVRKGLEVAFAPGFDIPDEFVEDVDRMTFSAYDDSASGFDDYVKEEPLDQRMRESGKPLMVVMGAEEQLIDEPAKRLAEYRQADPGTQTHLIAGAGHSPNVEKPAETAALVLGFGAEKRAAEPKSKTPAQQRLQRRAGVRTAP